MCGVMQTHYSPDIGISDELHTRFPPLDIEDLRFSVSRRSVSWRSNMDRNEFMHYYILIITIEFLYKSIQQCWNLDSIQALLA